MSVDIDAIKRKLLIKYPTLGSVIANLEFQANKDITTAGTDGKVVLYNPKFVNGLSDNPFKKLGLYKTTFPSVPAVPTSVFA